MVSKIRSTLNINMNPSTITISIPPSDRRSDHHFPGFPPLPLLHLHPPILIRAEIYDPLPILIPNSPLPPPAPDTLFQDRDRLEHLLELGRAPRRAAEAVEVVDQHLRVRFAAVREQVGADQGEEFAAFGVVVVAVILVVLGRAVSSCRLGLLIVSG